jgi:predicted ATPase
LIIWQNWKLGGFNLVDNTSQLVAYLLSTPLVPADIIQEIHKKSEGTPLIIEEIVQELKSTDRIVVGADGSITVKPEALITIRNTVPQAVTGLINSKV